MLLQTETALPRAEVPMAMLQRASTRLHAAALPIAMLSQPVVTRPNPFTPTATLRKPLVREVRAEQPKETLSAVVHPRTIPATFGVSAETAEGGAAQHNPVAVVEQA
jgi:hypothetical protein